MMPPRRRGNRQHAARGLDAAIERQLAEQQDARDVAPRDVAGGGEDPEGNRQIEGRTGLADVGRREVHRHAVGRKLEPRVADRAAHAIATLPDARIRQADHLKRRQAKRDVDFDLHEARFDPKDGGRAHGGKHRQRQCKAWRNAFWAGNITVRPRGTQWLLHAASGGRADSAELPLGGVQLPEVIFRRVPGVIRFDCNRFRLLILATVVSKSCAIAKSVSPRLTR